MKQTKFYLGCVLLLAAMLLTSCSKSPKVARLMPNDAITMRIDVKQIFDKTKAGDNDKAKAQVAEALEGLAKTEDGKKLMKEIAADPAKAGIDLRQPLWVSVDTKGKNPMLLGELHSKDDFAKLLTTLSAAPQEKDGISYVKQDDNVIAFDDEVFVITNTDLDTLIKRFKADDTANTMAENDDFSKLVSCKGLAQMLIPLNVADEQLDASTKKMMPEGAQFKDLSVLLDLNSEKGALTLTAEVIVKSDAWQKLYDNSDKVARKIDGDFAQYCSADGLALFCNIDGKAYIDVLEKTGILNMKEVAATGKTDDLKKALGSIDGDIALSIGKWEGFIPNIALYAKTKDDAVEKTLAANGIKNSSEMQIGTKDGASYIAVGGKPFEAAQSPINKSNLTSHRFYFYIGTPLATKAVQGLGSRSSASMAQPVIDMIKSLEIYDTGKMTTEFRLNMKDADKDPIELATSMLMGQL